MKKAVKILGIVVVVLVAIRTLLVKLAKLLKP